MIADETIDAYVDTGPEMVAYLRERTPIQFRAVPDFPDYHPEQTGGLPRGGRSLECELFPYGELGEWKDRLHISPYYPAYHLAIGETTLVDDGPRRRNHPLLQAGDRGDVAVLDSTELGRQRVAGERCHRVPGGDRPLVHVVREVGGIVVGDEVEAELVVQA